MKVVSLRLDSRTVEKLDEVARRTLASRSEVIRSALAVYIALLENIGFYFKPSLPFRNVDVYEERNAVNVDLGNLTSVTILSVSYGGVGEKELDFRRDLHVVAEVMANQLVVESICRFVKPLVIMLSTANDFEYSMRFFRLFRSAMKRRENVKVMLAGVESFFETKQSGFSCTLVGLRDMSVRNSPRRGDRIFFFGNSKNTSQLDLDDLLDVDVVRKLAELVRNGRATAIFPIKSGGLEEVANYAASLAGGRACIVENRQGCPATAVLLTSEYGLSEFGCEEVGEIL